MTDYSKRTCGRASDQYDTCDSVIFPISGGEYRQDQSLSVGEDSSISLQKHDPDT